MVPFLVVLALVFCSISGIRRARSRVEGFACRRVGKLPSFIRGTSAPRNISARDASLPPIAQAVDAEVLSAVPAVATGAGNNVGSVHLRFYVSIRAVSKIVFPRRAKVGRVAQAPKIYVLEEGGMSNAPVGVLISKFLR